MSTTTLPALAELRDETFRLASQPDIPGLPCACSTEVHELVARYNYIRGNAVLEKPDPQPVIGRMLAALSARGIKATFSDAELRREAGESSVSYDGTWGVTNWEGSADPHPYIVVRSTAGPQGRLLTLAHEAGHAITVQQERTRISLGFEDILLSARYVITGDYILNEALAEQTSYRVGRATGTGVGATIHGGYLAQYLSKIRSVDIRNDIWEMALPFSEYAAGVLLS